MMAVLSFLAWVLVLLPWLIGAGVMLFALWRAARLYNTGRGAAVTGWLVLAASPAVVYVVMGVSFNADEARRASYVASLERHRLDGHYPQRLVMQGYMIEAELAVLLHLYNFDEIEMYQERRVVDETKGQRFTRAGGEDCVLAAQAWLANRSGRIDRQLKNCVDLTTAYYKRGDDTRDAVHYLMGHATTHKAGNNLWSGGNYEVRLISGGQNRLVDYWEDYFSSRNSSMLCMVPIGVCAKKQKTHIKGPGRLKFLVQAIGATVPGTTAQSGG